MAEDGNNNDVPLHIFKDSNTNPEKFDAKGYSLSGKIMLSAIIILFFVIVLMLCLHIYARWYLRRARRLQLRRQRELRRTQLVFYNDDATPAAVSHGLDASILATLPVFTFDPEKTAPECAVCLSEFELGETGRVLPKCNHSFHIEYIHMWFHSHDTCPLCHAPVERALEPEVVVITVPDPFSEIGSGENENRTGSSSSSSSSSSVGLNRSKLPLFAFSWWDDKGTFLAGDTATIEVKVLENADKIDKKTFNPTLTVNGKEGNSSYVSTVLSDFEGDPNEWKVSFTPIRVGLFNVLISKDRYKVDDSSLHF